jgi:hypothetical protein
MSPAKQAWLVSLARLELLLSRKDYSLIEDAEGEYLRASALMGTDMVTQ